MKTLAIIGLLVLSAMAVSESYGQQQARIYCQNNNTGEIVERYGRCMVWETLVGIADQ